MNHEIAAALNTFNFRELFIEILGWDNVSSPPRALHIGEAEYSLRAVAQKWSFTAFVCETDELPDSQTLAKIAREAGKITPELLIVFQDKKQSGQIWQWARREPGKPVALRHQRVLRSQNNPLLIEKIEAISVSLDDEEKARKEGRDTVFAISQTVRAAFDVEKVTKKFYERFSKEHAAFLGFIKGIPDDEMQSWYASVMLNRLMFIYFIQHKGFLYFDGKEDKAYLLNQLKRAKKEKRPFYREFLRPLFERAFATPQNARSKADNALFGRVPYLNGGLFTTHQIEREHDSIQIPDSAFEKIFDFFDDYDWHLDDNPLREGREINPDVLGYIFEKYINQKQMGAYYTKEDITGYIARNTILPFWLERAREALPQAFEGENSVWKLLQENPDKYIYPAVRFGLRDEAGVLRELPAHIKRGVNDVSSRTDWNKPAPNDWGLPTEIWREVVARRQKYIEVRARLNGDVKTIDDLITLNLDIVQFCEDVVSLWADESLLRALWKTLAGNQNRTRKSNEEASNGIAVLDPTCGSGAFLFAAINILEPLYSACLDRMTGFAREAEDKKLTQKNADFREILARVDDTSHHPNREYFVLKSILVNNLFGVDIMEEAVEICKLRLFLKLASCVEPNASDENFGIEPLPDIDFNIRAGNTLVGYATTQDLKSAFSYKLKFDDTLQQIETQAQDIERAFDLFRQCQTENRDAELPEAKRVLRERLETLRDQLDAALAEQYEIGLAAKPKKFAAWRDSHQPFHWFIEFYGILKRGGFDCIIGNPPYVEYSKVRSFYEVRDFITESANNLYALVAERSKSLVHDSGCIGLILPNSSVSATKMASMQNLLSIESACWVSNYAWRPSKLFEGANMLLAIWIIGPSNQSKHYSSKYLRWQNDYRSTLFQTLDFTEVTDLITSTRIPKSPGKISHSILAKCQIAANGETLNHSLQSTFGDYSLFYFRAVLYWFKVLTFTPTSEEDGVSTTTSEMKEILFANESHRDTVVAFMSSNLYSLYYAMWSSCQVVNSPDFDCHVNINELVSDIGPELSKLSKALMEDYQQNSIIQQREYSSRGREFTMKKQYFFIKNSKPIIDEIDRVLASHYGFTDEELDFIINYDIKYRMGKTDTAE